MNTKEQNKNKNVEKNNDETEPKQKTDTSHTPSVLKLTDLPALVLCLWAIYLKRAWIFSALLLSYSSLIKETAIISTLALFPYEKGRPFQFKKAICRYKI